MSRHVVAPDLSESRSNATQGERAPAVGGPGGQPVPDVVDGRDTEGVVGTTARGVPLRGDGATGRESLSFLGTRQSQGPIDPGTVVLRPNGCWQFRIDFNSFHDQTWDRCSKGGKLLESGGTTDQRFDFVAFRTAEHTDVACAPPFVVAEVAATRGTSSPVCCTGRSRTAKTMFRQTGTAIFVGRENVVVGGVDVPGLHSREVLRLSGGQTREVHIDIWFAATNGLPLKEEHSISVASPAPAPLNHVTYTERGSWLLRSVTPRT